MLKNFSVGGLFLTICFLAKKYASAVLIAVAMVLMSAAVAGACFVSDRRNYTHIEGKYYTLSAASTEAQKEFALQFGLQTEEYPEMIQRVRLPKDFDSFYTAYNEMQKTVGLDLSPYAGKSCVLYTYRLKNKEFSGGAVINLLILRERIIGGDITKDKSGGVILSFSGKSNLDFKN